MKYYSFDLVFRFLLLTSLYRISVSQIRLSTNRTRVSYYRTTTVKSPVTSNEEKPSIILQARTGQFFVYAFSPNDFEPSYSDTEKTENYGTNTVRGRFGTSRLENGLSSRYDYSASLYGRPDLPSWLNLAKTPSDHPANRGFLYGTPDREEFLDDVVILARNVATNSVHQKLIRIQVQDDKRYSSPVKQLAELWIQNYDVWEILSSTSNSAWSSDLSSVPANNNGSAGTLLDDLRSSISRAFRGRGVRPYIRDLKPATHAGARLPTGDSEKVGFVVYVGTAQSFPLGIQRLAIGLTKHQDMCNRSEIIPPNTFFSPAFKVDWCRFRLYNVTQPDPSDAAVLVDGLQVQGVPGLTSYDDVAKIPRYDHQDIRHYDKISRQRDYSWEWVMVAVVPLAILLVLVLILSAVFFGCREGQHWRDYKTPREQLAEYVNLRRTQDRLRMLSNQRQSLDILDATGESPPAPISRRVPPPASPTLSVGKQTVAQAAAVRGSGMDLYKDTDSFDERDQLIFGGLDPNYQQVDRRVSVDQQDALRRPSCDDRRHLITRDSSV